MDTLPIVPTLDKIAILSDVVVSVGCGGEAFDVVIF